MTRSSDGSVYDQAPDENSNGSGPEIKIDLTKPWFHNVRVPSMDSHFSTSWAGVALKTMALNGGSACVEKDMTAAIKEGVAYSTFLEGMTAAFPSLNRVFQYSTGDQELVCCTFASSNAMMQFEFDGDRSVTVALLTNDKALSDAFFAWFKDNTTKEAPRGRVYVLVNGQHGPEFRTLGVGGIPLERGNYEEEVLSGYDRVVKDLKSKKPAGRIAIFSGIQGGGKTHLIKGLLDEVDTGSFVIVPANLVVELAQPSMIPAMMRLHQQHGSQHIVFLVEDADEVLAPRMGDNMSSVSVMLNLGDGILGQILDIRLVCTTNAKHQEIDVAIKRPGRLSAMVHVRELSEEKSTEILRRLTGKEDAQCDGDCTLAEVYSLARADGWVAPDTDRKVGFMIDKESRIDVLLRELSED